MSSSSPGSSPIQWTSTFRWLAAAIGSLIGHYTLPGTWSILAGAGAGVVVAALTWREDMDDTAPEPEIAADTFGAPEGTYSTEAGK